MSNPELSASGSQAKPLNLGKFAPGGEAASAHQPEGETIFIKRTAAETVERKFDPAAQASDEFGLPLKEMLGVITYCYARGVFWSGGIAELLRNDPELRKAFGSNLPDGQDIRRFRRRYAEEIEEALETVYRVYPPAGQEGAQDTTQGQTEIVRRQASERLHDASWTDNVHGRPD